MDPYVVCSMCGHRLDSYGLYDMRRHNDYDMPLCRSCFQKLEENKQHPIHKICEKRHNIFIDYIRYEYKKQEEKAMYYNKKKDTSIDVMRYVTREEVVTVNNLHDLEGGDKIKVMINGEVYEAKVARRPPIDYSGEAELAIAVNIDKPLSKSWKDLGYDCFEDMIDDIAKKHGSLGHKEGRITDSSNYIKIHDAAHEGKKYVYADSFGKSIIRVINDDGSSTIYDADQIQVYLEEEDEDYFSCDFGNGRNA